jgi:transposase
MSLSRKEKSIVHKLKVKVEKTTAEITAKYGIHSTQINNWKKAVLEVIPDAFSSKRKRQEDVDRSVPSRIQHKTTMLSVGYQPVKLILSTGWCSRLKVLPLTTLRRGKQRRTSKCLRYNNNSIFSMKKGKDYYLNI